MIGSPAVREATDSRRSLRRSAASTRLPAAISTAIAAMATCMSRIRDCLQFRFTKRALMHVSSDLLTLRIITLFGRWDLRYREAPGSGVPRRPLDIRQHIGSPDCATKNRATCHFAATLARLAGHE